MTVYEFLMNKRDECVKKAWSATDGYMKTFWANASRGFEEKARNLSYEEGTRIISDSNTESM